MAAEAAAYLPIGHVADLFLGVAEVFLLWKAVTSWTKLVGEIRAQEKELVCKDATIIPKFEPVKIDSQEYCELKLNYERDGWVFTPVCEAINRPYKGPSYFIKGWTATNGLCTFDLGRDGGGRFICSPSIK